MILFPLFTKCIKHNFNTNRKFSLNTKKPPWSVLFFGADEFSLHSLKLLSGEYKTGGLLETLEVVTTFKGKINPVGKYAEERNLILHKWPINVPENKYHLGLVVSFGHLIPQNIIEKFPLGMLNVHASLLPRWRGAAPIIYALANGDTKSGVTIMRIRPDKFDIGEIVSQSSVDIPPEMKMPELHEKLGSLGGKELVKSLQNLPENLKNAKPQPNEEITFAPKVTPEFAVIKWDLMTSVNVHNLERSLIGFLPITSTWQGVSVKLINVKVCEQLIECDNTKRPGYVTYDKNIKSLRILCANNTWLSVEKVGVLGKRTMTAIDFNNGYLKKVEPECRYFK